MTENQIKFTEALLVLYKSKLTEEQMKEIENEVKVLAEFYKNDK